MNLCRSQALTLMVLILLLGSALRIVGLEQSPPGLTPDEACNSYDAYSLWHTGRDQHGVLFPTVLAAMNDYRMPLFMYSMAPLVGLGGLHVFTARLTAALWGIVAIAALYWLGTQFFGRLVGVIAALFLALSPWHVPLGRIAHETNATVLSAILTVGCWWRWRCTLQRRWLYGAAIVAALGLYTYSVMKFCLPFLVITMAFLDWRTVWAHRWEIVRAALVGLLLSVPLLYNTFKFPDLMQARYQEIATFRSNRPWTENWQDFITFAGYNFSPDFLFGRGDLDALQHPQGCGQLYLVQALLIAAGLGWGLAQSAQRKSLLVLGIWIIAGTLPAALTRPNLPGSGHALRSLLAVAPWQLLTGLGLASLLRWLKKPLLRLTLLSVVLGWVGLNSWTYFHYYFTQYSSDVPQRFDVEMSQLVSALDKVDDAYSTVYVTCHASWPYLHILFYTQYDPHVLQKDLPVREPTLFAPVTRLGKYHIVCDTAARWAAGETGLFVVPYSELPEVAPITVTTGFDGQPLYKIAGRP